MRSRVPELEETAAEAQKRKRLGEKRHKSRRAADRGAEGVTFV